MAVDVDSNGNDSIENHSTAVNPLEVIVEPTDETERDSDFNTSEDPLRKTHYFIYIFININ